MPRKSSSFTKRGKSLLRRKRPSIYKRALIKPYKPPPERVRTPEGYLLNIPESQIYRALEKLKVNFSSQVKLKGGSRAGGSLLDFVLWDKRIVLEFQGFFHTTAEGKAKDFWRKVRREQAGFMVVYLYNNDLKNLHRRLTQIMGAPARASISSGGYRI